MDMIVRKYEEKDKEVVNKIIIDNFGGEKNDVVVPDNIYQYVCELDNQVVGYFVATDITNIVRGYHYYIIDYVCVDVDHHRMGIGKYMMNYIIEEAKKNNVKFLQLTSSNKRPGAQKMYTNIGFSEYDTNIYRLVI